MPARTLKPCSSPGCHTLVTSGKCDRHQAVSRANRATEQRQDPLKPLYNCKRWRLTRLVVLAHQPVCTQCGQALATEVHHLIDAREWVARGNDFYDEANLTGLCKPCHDKTTGQRQH